MPLVTFFWCHLITYRTPCHASGHLVIYRECYGFERMIFTLRRFLPYTPSCRFQGFPGSGQFSLRFSRASCWSSKHNTGLTSRLNHSNPQKRYDGRFYLRIMVGRLRNEESASYGVWTLFAISEYVISVIFYPFSHRALWTVIN